MDLSRVPDDVLERAVAQINAGKPTEATFEQQVAIKAELVRRRSAADNVNANLEAAAAPLARDPETTAWMREAKRSIEGMRDLQSRMEGAGYTPEEATQAVRQEAGMPGAYLVPPSDATLQSGARAIRGYRNAEARLDDAMAEAMGHNAAPVDVTGPEMVTVDGVTFPAHRMSDGQPFNGMYTLRALREAKDAQREAQLAEMFSKSAQEDLATYGTRQLYEYGDDFDAANVTPIDPASLNPEERKQQEQLEARRQIEKRQYAQNKALRARASGQYEADRKKARERFTAMAMLAGGSQNINAGNRAMFNALLELPPAERQEALRQLMPMDPIRAKVEAENAAMGGRMAQAAMTAFLTNNPQATPEQRALLDLQMREREHALPPAVAAQRERARTGAVPGASPAGQRLLADIETRVIGPYATQVEVDAAVEEAVDSGVPREDAERYFSRRRNWGNWWGGGAEVE